MPSPPACLSAFLRGPRVIALCGSVALCAPAALLAQQRLADSGIAPAATRVARGDRITLDGSLTELSWRDAPVISDLRQNDPDAGSAATERTEVRVLFDSATLYVGVRAFDSQPDQIVARILQRDRVMVQDEFTGGLNFASDDAVAILLDPFRDRRNAIVFATNANGAEFDAQVTDQGREVNIAWRTVWRVAAARMDSGWSAEFAIPLRSIRHPDDGRAWGFNVFRMIRRKNEQVLWRSWSRDNAGFLKVSEAGELPGIRDLAREGRGVEVKTSAIGRAVHGDVDGRTTPMDGALDIKYEVRPGVTVDATANTDFAQADVDDVQINLTRFDLFFPEKRDFFLENSGVFDFGTRGGFEPPPWLMFFSRRIGISDSGEIPVLGGVRLTGREGRQTFGVMHMQTQAAFDQPRAGYSVARFKRDVGEAGYVGAMYSGLARSSLAQSQTYGADFQLWPTSTTTVQGFVAGVDDPVESPGATVRERLAHRLMVNREVDRWGVLLERMEIGAASDPPMGFATRTDVQRNNATLRFTARPHIPGVRRVNNFNFFQYIARMDGALQDWGVGPALGVHLESGDEITFFHLESHTVLDESFDLADRLTIPVGSYANAQTGMFITTAGRRPVSLNANAQVQQFYGGRLLSTFATANVAIGARGSIALTRAFNDARLPVGRLITNLSAARVGYAFNTRASVASTVQYDALDQVLNANARFTYQYRPGSELFVVLNEERDAEVARPLQPRTALVKLTYLARF